MPVFEAMCHDSVEGWELIGCFKFEGTNAKSILHEPHKNIAITMSNVLNSPMLLAFGILSIPFNYAMADHQYDPLDFVDPLPLGRGGRPRVRESLKIARACKKARKNAVAVAAPVCSAPPPKARALDAELQIASAFLCGRFAASHISTVARHVAKAVSSVARICGMLTNPASELTSELGEAFDARFLRHSKYNVVSILLQKQEEFLGRLEQQSLFQQILVVLFVGYMLYVLTLCGDKGSV